MYVMYIIHIIEIKYDLALEFPSYMNDENIKFIMIEI